MTTVRVIVEVRRGESEAFAVEEQFSLEGNSIRDLATIVVAVHDMAEGIRDAQAQVART